MAKRLTDKTVALPAGEKGKSGNVEFHMRLHYPLVGEMPAGRGGLQGYLACEARE